MADPTTVAANNSFIHTPGSSYADKMPGTLWVSAFVYTQLGSVSPKFKYDYWKIIWKVIVVVNVHIIYIGEKA